MSITNNAPVGAIPVTVDESGNLTGSSGLTFDPATSSLQLLGDSASFHIVGSGAAYRISLGVDSIAITAEGNGAVILRLLGLPNADPVSEGAVYLSSGTLKVSAG